MASEGPRFPGTTANLSNAGTSESAEPWVNPGNVVSDNATEAQIVAASYDSPDISQILVCSNFGFGIPGTATIDGIVVEIERRSIIASSGKDFRVQLAKGTAFANLVGSNKAVPATIWPTTATIATYGGVADLWGTTWTPAEINAASFALFLSAQANIANADIGVDFVRITVHYTATATQVDRSYSGAVTMSGVLKKEVRRAYAGAIAPSGVEVEMAIKNFFGTATVGPGGVMAREVRKVYAGSVSPQGTLLKQSRRTYTGILAPAGTITKRAQRSYAGSVASAGTLTNAKASLRSYAGSIATAGSIRFQTLKVLVGNLGSVGTLTRRSQRVYTGTVTSAGSLIRSIAKAYQSTLTSLGTLTRQTRKSLGGSVATAGSVANQLMTSFVQRSFSGTIAPAGSLTRQARRSFAGGSTQVGTLVQQVRRTFTGGLSTSGSAIIERLPIVKELSVSGIIGSSGNLFKRASRNVSGSIAIDGVLRRTVSRSFGGDLAPVGDFFRAFNMAVGGVIGTAGTLTTQVFQAAEGAPKFLRGHSRNAMRSAGRFMKSVSMMRSNRHDDG